MKSGQYNYDPIGNRTSVSETIDGEVLAKTYAANELNQYIAIANPDAVGLRGTATNTATVTVNAERAVSDAIAADSVPWHYALPSDNANGGVFAFAEIMAVVNPPGTNTPDIVSTASGHVYAPPQSEALVYDDDGNLLSVGRWQYTWNGENRLVRAEEQICPTNRTLRKVDYAYDHQGRMVWKKILRGGAEAPNWEEEKSTSYLWDGFNIIAETVAENEITNIIYNVWGLDIDGTMQGAGGVGGLLAVVKDDATVYLPCYDANGNITEYVAADGSIAAHREYDPFGGTVVATGDANAFSHWFSTKPWCAVTGLSEYQYRKYSPMTGRWFNRDPIEEEGGVNLYCYVANGTITDFDSCGLQSRELLCCTDEKIAQEKQTLQDEAQAAWNWLKGQPVPHMGTKEGKKEHGKIGKRYFYCNRVNEWIGDRIQKAGVPPCWGCNLVERFKFGANHWVVLCKAMNQYNVVVDEIVFDYWSGRNPRGEHPEAWLNKKYPFRSYPFQGTREPPFFPTPCSASPFPDGI